MIVSRNYQVSVSCALAAAFIGGCMDGSGGTSANSTAPVGAGGAGTVSVGTGGFTAAGTQPTSDTCVNATACDPAGSLCTTVSGLACLCSSVSKTWSCAAVSGSGGSSSVAAAGGAPATGGTSAKGGSTATTTASGGSTPTTAATCSGTTKQNQASTAFASIILGKYWVNNNIWGTGVTAGSNVSQSIWSTCNNGTSIGWGTSFAWTSGAANSVKSYASSVLGWHWGWKVARATTGLPVQVSTGASINCDWKYTVTRTGTVTMNVAYDLWIHGQLLTGASDEWDGTKYEPSDEVMIWLYRSNGAGPISTTGSPVATVTIAGVPWELYEGQISGAWKVHSYVRQANADTGTALNLQLFMKDLVSRGYLSTSKYVSSVEAGTEVFLGTGALDTSSYSCMLQ